MKFIKFILCATLAGFVSCAVAATTPSNAELNKEIAKINAQTVQLQNEVKALRQKVRKQQHVIKAHKKVSHSKTVSTKSAHASKSSRHLSTHNKFAHGPTVTTSPLVGVKSRFDEQDLLEQASSMNEDLSLLTQHQTYDDYLVAHGESLTRPVLEMSGGVEGQMYGIGGFGTQPNDRGVSLSKVEVDMNALASSWASAFISLNYDDTPTSTGNRSPRAVVYLERGWVTIGNLDVSPVYLTVGEMYTPFGKYSSLMLSTPLTQSMARIRSPSVVLGVSSHGFYGQAFIYSGFQTSGQTSFAKQSGANAGYTYKYGMNDANSVDFGAGYVSNLADSQGMQNTGNSNTSQFQGFALQNGNGLRTRVGALDFHAAWTTGPISFIGEYITPTNRFNVNDLSYNGIAAMPRALHTEIDYAFRLFNRPWIFGVTYGQTWQALALNLPRYSYSAEFNVFIWKNTMEGLEYRHDINYGAFADGGPNGHPGNLIVGNGGTRNSVLAQVGVYF